MKIKNEHIVLISFITMIVVNISLTYSEFSIVKDRQQQRKAIVDKEIDKIERAVSRLEKSQARDEAINQFVELELKGSK